jgi:hypothetical protein
VVDSIGVCSITVYVAGVSVTVGRFSLSLCDKIVD